MGRSLLEILTLACLLRVERSRFQAYIERENTLGGAFGARNIDICAPFGSFEQRR